MSPSAPLHPARAIHQQSLRDPQAFWLNAAKDIHWVTPPSRAYGRSERTGTETWFPNATLNTCYNALDRHVYPPAHSTSPASLAPPAHPPLVHHASKPCIHHVCPLPASTSPSRTISYGEALEQVQLLAGVLRHTMGVGKGDRVVVYMPNSPEALYAMLACARIGAVHSVVFGGFAARELAKRIQDSGCKAVLASSCGLEPKAVIEYHPLLVSALQQSTHKPDAYLLFRRNHVRGHDPPLPPRQGWAGTTARQGLPTKHLDWEMEMRKIRAEGKEVRQCVEMGSEELAYTLYTSGTTGMPKGVVRQTGGHAVALRYSMENVFGIRPQDTMFTASDVGWVVGHSYIVYAPLFLGCTTVVFEGKPIVPDAGVLWKIVQDHRVSALFTAPTALRAIRREDPQASLMRKSDLRCLRTLFLAGERSEPQIVNAYVRLLSELAAPGCVVNDNYWSTESGSPITALSLSASRSYAPMPPRPGAAGLPLPGMDVRVVDDEGRELPPGQMGNLVLKTPLAPSALGGLWNNPEGFEGAYFAKFRGKGDWFVMGDTGMIDEDGYVSVLSRSDDIINVAAHRLSTGLIEQVVGDHEDVVECCVVGAPDKVKGKSSRHRSPSGQTPFALVVLASSSEAASSRTSPRLRSVLNDVNAHVRSELGPIAQLSGLVASPKIPKTRSGKRLLRTVRAIVELAAAGRFEDGEVPVPPTVEDASIVPLVRTAVNEHFGGSGAVGGGETKARL